MTELLAGVVLMLDDRAPEVEIGLAEEDVSVVELEANVEEVDGDVSLGDEELAEDAGDELTEDEVPVLEEPDTVAIWEAPES
jgi:hypothetical protein